jgi:hypothetical protein
VPFNPGVNPGLCFLGHFGPKIMADNEILAGIERSIWPMRMARVCPIPTIPMNAAKVLRLAGSGASPRIRNVD